MRLFWLQMMLCSLAFAGESLVLTPNSIAKFDLPTAAFQNPGSLRLEMRFHDWSLPADRSLLFSIGGFAARLSPENGGSLLVNNWADSFTNGQGNVSSFNLSGYPDAVLRVQRDISKKLFTVEVWRIDGTGYISRSISMDSVQRGSWTTEASALGGTFTSARLAYIRMFSTLVPPGTLFSSAPAGDLWNFEFDTSLPDSSTSIRLAPKLPTATTPSYPPACIINSNQRVVRSGFDAPLDGSPSIPLDGNYQLSYSWSVLRSPEASVNWRSSLDVAKPVFQPAAFGTYLFLLRVTDSSNQSTTCTAKYGAVITDDNNIVQFSDPQLGLLFGPMLRLGTSPWSWYDDRHVALADFFGELQKKEFLDSWNQPGPGTISVEKGSRIVTGTGTTFQSTYCKGATFSDDSLLIVWYPLDASNRSFGRWPLGIRSCDSDTQLTLTDPYQGSPSSSSLQYATMTNTDVYYWINGSTNANYYDNVMAFYSLYYRSGIDTYLDYARTLADRWWTQPWINEGHSCSVDGDLPCIAPRLRSMTGLVARALDGRPEMWPGLNYWCSGNDRYFLNITVPLFDLREQAYQLNEVSLCALFDPDLDRRQQYRADLTAALDGIWARYQQPEGHWLNGSSGLAPWNGQAGTVQVTHGSQIVEGNGTAWSASQIPPGSPFWVADSLTDSYFGDPVSYEVTVMDATHLSLDRPYEGVSSSNRSWQVNNLLGAGTQPFMMGVAASAFHLAYLATGDARANRFVLDIAQWLRNYGYRTSVRGLYYARYFVNCEPIKEGLKNCADDPPFASRVLGGEVLNAFALAYAASGDPGLKTIADSLFAGLFGKDGGPQADGSYDPEIENGGWTFQVKRAKDFGFLFGFGQSWRWTAATGMEFSSRTRSGPTSSERRLPVQ